MNPDRLRVELATEFAGSDQAVRAVTRQARDLADSGLLRSDGGYELTATAVIDHLDDAPDGYTVTERWNWWVGSLEVVFGGEYRQFRVRADIQ